LLTESNFVIISTSCSRGNDADLIQNVRRLSMCVGKGGAEGDGDIFNPENLEEFQRFVLDNTSQREPGVHFVMADGVSGLFEF